MTSLIRHFELSIFKTVLHIWEFLTKFANKYKQFSPQNKKIFSPHICLIHINKKSFMAWKIQYCMEKNYNLIINE